MRKKCLIFVSFFMIVTVTGNGVFPGTVFAESRKQEIQKENEELANLNKKMQDQVQTLDKKMEKSHAEYDQYSKKLASVENQIVKIKEQLKEAQKSKKKQYEIMSKRIKFLYENGDTAYLEIIFEAKSFQDFLTKAEYVSKISKYDSTMFQKLQKTQDKMELASKNLKTEYKNVSELTTQAKKKKDAIDKAVLEKKQKMEEYQKKLASNQELLAQYEAQERQAQQEQERKSDQEQEQGSQTSPSGDSGTTTGSGNLTWPVPSCHSISSGYGYRIHPVTGERKFHAGIDIPCGTGSTIVAADGGTVVDAGYTAYNGNYLKISHGNGIETMYLHCSRLLVSSGSHVSKGQTIAKSGATGMVSGAHLHFVVKKNGNYVNPSNYL